MSKRTWILGAAASAVAVLGALVVVGAMAGNDDQTVPNQSIAGTQIPESESLWQPLPDDGPYGPDALITPISGRRLISAPIDSAELVTGATPGSYELHLVVGLPTGCAAQGGFEVNRNGDKVEVKVYDTMPYPNNMACTTIYGTYKLTVPITGLTPGHEVHLSVNTQKHFIFTP